jgi:hypothetical protein
MSAYELFELSSVILASLGGGAAIIFSFSSWLGKIWANRLMAKEKAEHAQELESLRNKLTQDTESYKIKLKKSEFLFQKEYEAASELIALKWIFLPGYSRPSMDWNEVCDEIAWKFEKIEIALTDFISRYGAVLKEDVQEHIGNAIHLAGEHKFEITDAGVSSSANSAADEIFRKLHEAERLLLKQVHLQSSI